MSPARLARAALLALTVAGVTGCEYLFEPQPCPDEAGTDRYLGGIWALQTVNGRAYSSPGWVVPNPNPLATPQYIRAGSLRFVTIEFGAMSLDVEEAACDGFPESSRGRTVARWLLADATGAPSFPGKSYAGNFRYDHATREVTLTAYDEKKRTTTTLKGTVSADNRTMTFTGDVPFVGTQTLVFRR